MTLGLGVIYFQDIYSVDSVENTKYIFLNFICLFKYLSLVNVWS